MSKAEQIKQKLEDAGIRYWAGDNISEVLQKGDKEELIEDATVASSISASLSPACNTSEMLSPAQ